MDNDTFINRTLEIKDLNRWGKPNSMIVIYGRRRVGKTRLLVNWLNKLDGAYSQAIEGAIQLQIDQTMKDLSGSIETQLRPTNWIQFFEILETIKKPLIICLDEFPYLVETDPSLPSILQKWWDHRRKKNITLLLCGSSQKMMHSIFLNEPSPLYGRATRILKLEPMSYAAFCLARGLKANDQNSFLKYSLVGGIPKYWEYVNKNESVIELANILYFNSGAILEKEPHRMLSDEKVEGITPLNVLEAIGRGVHKPSEIGGRIGASQGSLSKVFALLINSSIIVRETPFGTPAKDSKKALYKIHDPMLKFWFSVYSGLRSQWMKMSDSEKKQVIYQNASIVFEEEVRRKLGGSRFWSDKEEYDVVFSDQKNSATVVEVKFANLSKETKIALEKKLKEKVNNSNFFSNFQRVQCSIIDWSDNVGSR